MCASWCLRPSIERWRVPKIQGEGLHPTWEVSQKDSGCKKICNCIGGYEGIGVQIVVASWKCTKGNFNLKELVHVFKKCKYMSFSSIQNGATSFKYLKRFGVMDNIHGGINPGKGKLLL